MSDTEQCSNWLQLDLISLVVNFTCELGQIMIRYDFLWAGWVILNNIRTDFNLTLFHLVKFSCELGQIMTYGLDEWFWAMFKTTQTWPNFTFGQLFMLIEANSDTSSVRSSNKDHPIARHESVHIMQVVLKITMTNCSLGYFTVVL